VSEDQIVVYLVLWTGVTK